MIVQYNEGSRNKLGFFQDGIDGFQSQYVIGRGNTLGLWYSDVDQAVLHGNFDVVNAWYSNGIQQMQYAFSSYQSMYTTSGGVQTMGYGHHNGEAMNWTTNGTQYIWGGSGNTLLMDHVEDGVQRVEGNANYVQFTGYGPKDALVEHLYASIVGNANSVMMAATSDAVVYITGKGNETAIESSDYIFAQLSGNNNALSVADTVDAWLDVVSNGADIELNYNNLLYQSAATKPDSLRFGGVDEATIYGGKNTTIAAYGSYNVGIAGNGVTFVEAFDVEHLFVRGGKGDTTVFAHGVADTDVELIGGKMNFISAEGSLRVTDTHRSGRTDAFGGDGSQLVTNNSGFLVAEDDSFVSAEYAGKNTWHYLAAREGSTIVGSRNADTIVLQGNNVVAYGGKGPDSFIVGYDGVGLFGDVHETVADFGKGDTLDLSRFSYDGELDRSSFVFDKGGVHFSFFADDNGLIADATIAGIRQDQFSQVITTWDNII